MEDYRAVYKEEAHELLCELESSLLELEEMPEDSELIGRVFRAMHTIKGSGAMFGFQEIADFTHEIESVFDMVRDGKIAVTRELVDLTLSARDHIKIMLGASEDGIKSDPLALEEIVSSFREFIPHRPDYGMARSNKIEIESKEHFFFRVRFLPDSNILLKGVNPLLLLRELKGIGACVITTDTGSIPELKEFNPEKCYLSWDVIINSPGGASPIKDVFIFVEDDLDITLEALDNGSGPETADNIPLMGEILLKNPGIPTQKLLATWKERRNNNCISSPIESGNHPQKDKTGPGDSIRVAASKLDKLVDLVGEIVTVKARLSQRASEISDPELLAISEEVERLTADLRENAMSIRMLPMGITFNKFKRLIRDLSKELGKDIRLATRGGETEVDKTVIEHLDDPLVHIIRNCIDHGIEKPDHREKSGKPKQGVIHITARHVGASVMITVSDDGAGLDTEAIIERATSRGLLPGDLKLEEKEAFSLIFEPGFSTAKTVSGVSGRGVGLDVVKKNVEAFQGSVEVKSKKGVGTTVQLKLPLTLAIVDGLLVKIGEGYFIIPLSSVQGCEELSHDHAVKAGERNFVEIRNDIVPYLRLRDLFSAEGAPPNMEQAVIALAGEDLLALGVDYVVGKHQTVIKNLGRAYSDINYISGATILGDGTVALILDVAQLVSLQTATEKRGGRIA